MSPFFEDLVLGERVDLGTFTFTREAIVDFARRYDPQPFHLDDAAAAAGPFGRLAASGWHTAAVWMKLHVAHRQRLMAEAVAAGEAVPAPGPSPGFRNLAWIRPVIVDDTIRFFATLTGKRATARPGWGLVLREGTAENQRGEPVYRFEGRVLWQRRPMPPA